MKPKLFYINLKIGFRFNPKSNNNYFGWMSKGKWEEVPNSYFSSTMTRSQYKCLKFIYQERLVKHYLDTRTEIQETV